MWNCRWASAAAFIVGFGVKLGRVTHGAVCVIVLADCIESDNDQLVLANLMGVVNAWQYGPKGSIRLLIRLYPVIYGFLIYGTRKDCMVHVVCVSFCIVCVDCLSGVFVT